MKHLIGGYCVGFIALFYWIMERGSYDGQRVNAGIALILASIFAIPFGLATWGLLTALIWRLTRRRKVGQGFPVEPAKDPAKSE